MKLILVLFSVFCFGLHSQANERVLPEKILLEKGLRPFKNFRHFRGLRKQTGQIPRGLPWPVQFQDPSHTIAQNYVNFQDYGDGAYFHKGCDLRTHQSADVRAPVTGILEAGYYGYDTKPDGSQTKFWTPWKGVPHNDPYFELALVTQDGYRFELHHVDSMNLPQTTLDALAKGGVVIPQGQVIGKVIPWGGSGDVYNHIHYNIYRQDGVIMNPEFYSEAVADHVAPKIHGVFGIKTDGSVLPLGQGGVIQDELQEIVVAATENRDNDVYIQTPVFAGIVFENGSRTVWDFHDSITTPDGRWPDLREVFRPQIKLPGGKKLITFGQYGKGMFLFRLKVDSGRGKFEIRVADTATNFSSFKGTLD